MIDALRQELSGRRVLVVADVVQAAGAMAARLADYGVEDVLLLASRAGTGALPEAAHHILDLPPAPLMEAIHTSQRALQALPEEAVAAVEAFDPEREAVVMGPFFYRGEPVLGRRFYGARPAAWQALEDKIRIEAVWGPAGIDHAPSRSVVSTLDALNDAHEALDQGLGTVWAADDREGFNGGAQRTYWVRGPEQARQAAERLAAESDHARVMPFLDGLPCSVHGVVFADATVVLRPAEMVVLRRDQGNGLLYMRAATTWDPAPEKREQMRDAARRLGDYLRASLDYRGAFTLDGVMTRQGFRPTECNPRVGAALSLMLPDFPFDLLSFALIEGCDVSSVDKAALERSLLEQADGQRRASVGLTVDHAFDRTQVRWLRHDDQGWHSCEESEAHGKMMAGPGPSGGFINLRLTDAGLPVGLPVAPLAASFVRYCDEQFGTGIGPAWPAPDYR